MSLTNEPTPIPQSHPTGERRAELERIRDAVWPPNESADDRKARIERNVAAFNNRLKLNVYPRFERMIPSDNSSARLQSHPAESAVLSWRKFAMLCGRRMNRRKSVTRESRRVW